MSYDFIGTFGTPAITINVDGNSGDSKVYVPWMDVIHMMNYLLDDRCVIVDNYPAIKQELNHIRRELNEKFKFYDRIEEMEKHIRASTGLESGKFDF